jgi:hypothetical protein
MWLNFHKNRRPTLEVRRLKALYARAGREAGANPVTALDGGTSTSPGGG